MAKQTTKKTVAKKKTAKKAVVKKKAQKKVVAKKAVAKKSPSKKATAKKAVAKKAVAKKAVAKKAVAKKAVAKKAVTKKAVAKKTVTKKAVAKKSIAKKAVLKKTVTKKAIANNNGAKKEIDKSVIDKLEPTNEVSSAVVAKVESSPPNESLASVELNSQMKSKDVSRANDSKSLEKEPEVPVLQAKEIDLAKGGAPKEADAKVSQVKVKRKDIEKEEVKNNEKITSKSAKELGEKIMEEVAMLSEDYKLSEIKDAIREIDFFYNNDSDECFEKYCENLATTFGYCRFHYIKNWKSIRKKRGLLSEGRLQLYIEELINKFPAKYIEAIIKDLSGDKEFYKALKNLNIDTSYQFEDGSGEFDADEDLMVETKTFNSSKGNFDEEEI